MQPRVYFRYKNILKKKMKFSLQQNNDSYINPVFRVEEFLCVNIIIHYVYVCVYTCTIWSVRYLLAKKYRKAYQLVNEVHVYVSVRAYTYTALVIFTFRTRTPRGRYGLAFTYDN